MVKYKEQIDRNVFRSHFPHKISIFRKMQGKKKNNNKKTYA